MYTMEAILTGIPQFIVASITILTTTAQARYLLNLEKDIRRRIDEGKKVPPEMPSSWHYLLIAWWVLTGTAMFCVFFRILPSMFVSDDYERVCPLFVWFDFAIILGLSLGYLLLMIVAYKSWDYNRWRGKPIP